MIAKLQVTLGGYKNKDQTQNPHKQMGGTLNSESTTTEPPPKNGQQP